MVRGPAAVLGLLGVAWAYLLVADQLPAIHGSDASRIVAGAVGTALIAAAAAGTAGLADTPYLAPLVLLGAGLVAGALDAADAGAAATVPETVAYACAGVLFAALLDTPALLVVIPLFVAGIDVISVLSGPAHLVPAGTTQPGDPLSLELPAWHGGPSALGFGVASVVFTGVFAAWSRRRGLHVLATAVAMTAALVAGVVLAVATGRTIPQLPLLALGFLGPNLRRIARLVRAEGATLA